MWAQPRPYVGLGSWYVNITRGDRRYENLVNPDHRTPLPSEQAKKKKRVWVDGRRSESSAAAGSSSGVGPQASATSPVKKEADGQQSDVGPAATVVWSDENEEEIEEEANFDPPDEQEPGTEAKEEENPQADGSA